MEFQAFPKIPRLNRDCVITEKIDGTNAQVFIFMGKQYGMTDVFRQYGMETDGAWLLAGSRSRYLNAKEDNYGFFKWVSEHREELVKQLGDGQHFGEWWGAGIGKRYPGAPKVFSLFNTARWQVLKDQKFLTVCDVAPTLYEGRFDTHICDKVVADLIITGSRVWPGAKSEGIVVYHKAAGSLFKVTCEKDESPKGIA